MKRYILLLIAISLLVFTACENDSTKTYDFDKVKRQDLARIINNKADLADLKIKIDYYKPKLIYNKTNTEYSVDENLCNLLYEIKITNLRDEPIELFYKAFYSEEMYNKLQLSSEGFGTVGKTLKLKPEQGFYLKAGVLLKHTKKFTNQEAAIFNREHEKLEIFLVINNQEYYIFIDGDDVLGNM